MDDLAVNRPRRSARRRWAWIACCAALAELSCEGTLESRGDAGRAASTDATGRDVGRFDAAAPEDAPPDEDARGVPADAPIAPDPICEPWPVGIDAYDQSVAPLEQRPHDAAARTILLVAGPSSDHAGGQHEFFAGMSILAHVLCQTPGVVPVLVRDGWPLDETLLDDADAIALYADGGDRHPFASAAHRAAIQRQIDRGVGFAAIHYAVEPPADFADTFRTWLGGNYETGYSINPLWRGHFEPPAHAITRGVGTFEIDDEWYYAMRWLDPPAAVMPTLEAVPPDGTRTTTETSMHPGRLETTSWAFERPDGGRSFGFTGGHWHGNWGDSPETPYAGAQRRVVAQGILWTAGIEAPEGGVPVALDPSMNGLWIDRR